MKRIILFHTLGSRSLSVATVAALVSGVLSGPGIAQTSGDTPPAAPQTTQGDLTHLVYTARSGLVAYAIAPDDGGIVNSTATAIEVATVAGAGVEVSLNGQVVPLKKLGRRAELDDGTVRYTYYGIVLAPGVNNIVLTPLGAGGLRGPSIVQHVWGPGAPASIKATGCRSPRADGRTPCVVRFSVLDAWGHPAAPGSTLKAAVTDGDAVFLPAGITGAELVSDPNRLATNPGAPQHSIAVVLSTGSTATLQLVPGSIPGRIRIAAGIGEVSTSVAFDAMAFARPPFVTGLATVGIGAVPGDLGEDPTAPDGTNSRRGRVALYGTGLLSGNAVGSLAYDTAGSLAATSSTGTFNDDPSDRPYATYGDASTRRNDALTQDKLYARVDDGYNSAMWGEFEATTGPQGAAGAAALQTDGARVVLGSASTSVSAFTAANEIGYGRQVLTTTGLATLEALAHDNLIIGSETVTLVSLDRLTGVILKQTTLQNIVDYTIDYTSGIIHFINVPLPYDSEFNPQQVLVTYEYSAVGANAKTTGARFDAPFGRFDGIRVGLGYLNDVTGSGDFTLFAENAGGLLPGGGWSISHAGSNGLVPGASDTGATGGSGSAFRLAGTSASGPYKLSFGYDATSAGYDNPFGDLQTPGLTDYHATLLRSFANAHGDFALSYDRERNSAVAGGSGASSESNLAAIINERLNPRLTVSAGLTMHTSDTAGTAADGSGAATASESASVAQADLGVEWKALHNVALTIKRLQSVGGTDPTQPAQTTAQASWDLNGHGRIYAQELMSDTPARTLDGTTGIGTSQHAFELGIEQAVDANTSVESKYDVAGTGNASDINASIGVKERLAITKELKGDLFVQRGVGSGSSSGPFTAYGLSLGYADGGGRFRATGSLQDRTGTNGGVTYSLGAAGRLFGDFSLLAADQASRMPGTSTTDSRIALAWRPSTSDRGALFAGYERAAGNADVAGSQSGVVSLDGVYRPARRLEVTGRFARKVDGDSNYTAGTSLVGLGIRQQLGPRFDAGAETRAVLVKTAGGGLHSTALEFGAMLANTLRAAVGYNFGATADPTLAAAPTRKGFYVTLTTTIDRIFGWGGH